MSPLPEIVGAVSSLNPHLTICNGGGGGGPTYITMARLAIKRSKEQPGNNRLNKKSQIQAEAIVAGRLQNSA